MDDWNAIVREGKEGRVVIKYGLGKRKQIDKSFVMRKPYLLLTRFSNHRRNNTYGSQ